MSKKFLPLIALLIVPFSLIRAGKVFEFNSTCQQAYLELTKLKLSSGSVLLEKAKQQNPDNLIPVYLDNYIDLVTLFFNEERTEWATKKPILEARIKALEEGDNNSPYYRYCLSTLYLQRAFIGIKFGETWRASWDARKAFLLIKENKKQFPTFSPNDLVYGGLQTVISTLPAGYSFLAGFVGLSGSLQEGMKLVRGFVNGSDPYEKLMSNEGIFIYCYLMYHIENKKPETFAYIEKRKPDLVNNHLLCYMGANLAITDKRLDMAKNLILGRNTESAYTDLPIWDYSMGYIKLYHLETKEAILYLEKYLNRFKGRFYIKDTYLKLAWCHYLLGDMNTAEAERANILKYGATDTDADKQALKDAKSGKWPNIILLKARLLFDGGYYQESLALLNQKSVAQFSVAEEKLEYYYRLGRIYDETKKETEALKYYETAYQLGLGSKEYYAARAALQTGEIYERQNKKKLAITYYQKCLDLKDHEYKNSLDQRANAGIERCDTE